MRSRPAAATLALVLGGGCAGVGAVQPPDGLAYDIPDPNPATYAFADTTQFILEAPGVSAVEVRTIQEGTAELEFRRSPTGLTVEVRFPRFRGAFQNDTQGTARTDEGDIDGTVGVDLTYRGRVEVADTPALSPLLLQMTDPESLVRPFFIRLPGRAVQRGARWVDTLTTTDAQGATVSTSTTVTTAELAGDTVVDGRRLLRILTTSLTDVVVTGESGGVAIEERLRGRVTGRILWDDAAHVLVERFDEGRLSGTLTMPGTGADPLPVSATTRRRVLLRP